MKGKSRERVVSWKPSGKMLQAAEPMSNAANRSNKQGLRRDHGRWHHRPS